MTETTTATPAASSTPAAAGAGTTPAPAGAAPNPTAGSTPAAATPPADGKPAVKESVLGGASQGEQGKPTTGKETTPPAGSELAVKVPEGFTADPKTLDAVKTWATENKVSQETLDKAMALYAETSKASAQSQVEAVEKQSTSWETEILSDKDIGGAHVEETKANLREAARLSPEAKALMDGLDRIGMGNFPPAVRFLSNFGKSLKEDSTHPAAPAPGAPSPMSFMDRLDRAFSVKPNG